LFPGEHTHSSGKLSYFPENSISFPGKRSFAYCNYPITIGNWFIFRETAPFFRETGLFPGEQDRFSGKKPRRRWQLSTFRWKWVYFPENSTIFPGNRPIAPEKNIISSRKLPFFNQQTSIVKKSYPN